MCACAWVRGLLSRFFSRGCVRVGACVCACARVGGVGCRAARTFGRGRVGWFLHIHREHKGINCLPRPKLLHREHKGISCLPLPQPQGSLPRPQPLYHESKGIICLPHPTYQGLFTSPKGCLAYMGVVCFSLGYLVGRCLLGYLFSWLPYWVLFGWGGGVVGGGVFLVGVLFGAVG